MALVSLTPSGTVSTVTITRTADTNAYTANDVIGAATGSTAAVEFTNIGRYPAVDSSQVMLTSARLEIDVSSVPSGMTSFRLHLYSGTPPSALGDNAPWDLPSGDRASYRGYIDLGTPVDLGSTLYVETNGINKQITVLANESLFGYLTTIGGYTPGSADVFKIVLHGISL